MGLDKLTQTEILQLVKELKTKLIETQSYELATYVRDLERKIENAFTETIPESYVIKFKDEEHLKEFLINLQIQYPYLFHKFISDLDESSSS
jgi:hypothetical protein